LTSDLEIKLFISFMGDVITGKLHRNICLDNENYWFGFVK